MSRCAGVKAVARGDDYVAKVDGLVMDAHTLDYADKILPTSLQSALMFVVVGIVRGSSKTSIGSQQMWQLSRLCSQVKTSKNLAAISSVVLCAGSSTGRTHLHLTHS